MREAELLPSWETRARCLVLGESEEGGPPVPLRVKTHIHNRVMGNQRWFQWTKWAEEKADHSKLSSTYFPESLQPGGVVGTLGELCNNMQTRLIDVSSTHKS